MATWALRIHSSESSLPKVPLLLLPHYSVDNTGTPYFTDKKSHTWLWAYSLLLITLVASEHSAEFLDCANGHKQEQTKQKKHLPGKPGCPQSIHCHSAAPVLCALVYGTCNLFPEASQHPHYPHRPVFFVQRIPRLPCFHKALGQQHLSLTGTSLHQGLQSMSHSLWDLCPQPSPGIANSCWLPGRLHVLNSQEGRKRKAGEFHMRSEMDGQLNSDPRTSTTH